MGLIDIVLWCGCLGEVF